MVRLLVAEEAAISLCETIVSYRFRADYHLESPGANVRDEIRTCNSLSMDRIVNRQWCRDCLLLIVFWSPLLISFVPPAQLRTDVLSRVTETPIDSGIRGREPLSSGASQGSIDAHILQLLERALMDRHDC